MKLYYVEKKSYYQDAQGRDIQTADGGQHPIIYQSAEKAVRAANFSIKTCIDTFDMQVTIDNDNYPCKGDDILLGTRLEDPFNGTRTEIRVYEIETFD